MKIENNTWGGSTRRCDFSLCLQDACVFADFNVDEARRVYLVRISFDGYGCCGAPAWIERMGRSDSKHLLKMVNEDSFEQGAEQILRDYFRSIRSFLWEDALRTHALI